ncbi:hypothetical protein MJO28_006450 [Puccinia striiformis f. sp. tritici]|uniref:Uncharacterized protein n=1 Tax=Puccinia striiformis f. sp. tritici TaxID=168172 RepID=A0ACC0EHG9_9BASI|nr:hypothetical protein MJO28_006450 [Puccinia striiformis f. sp. tritici]
MGDEQGSPDSSATDHTVEQDQIHPEKIVHKYEYNPLRTVEREHDSVDHQLDFAGHSNDIARWTNLRLKSDAIKAGENFLVIFSQKHYSWIMYILIIQKLHPTSCWLARSADNPKINIRRLRPPYPLLPPGT